MWLCVYRLKENSSLSLGDVTSVNLTKIEVNCVFVNLRMCFSVFFSHFRFCAVWLGDVVVRVLEVWDPLSVTLLSSHCCTRVSLQALSLWFIVYTFAALHSASELNQVSTKAVLSCCVSSVTNSTWETNAHSRHVSDKSLGSTNQHNGQTDMSFVSFSVCFVS